MISENHKPNIHICAYSSSIDEYLFPYPVFTDDDFYAFIKASDGAKFELIDYEKYDVSVSSDHNYANVIFKSKFSDGSTLKFIRNTELTQKIQSGDESARATLYKMTLQLQDLVNNGLRYNPEKDLIDAQMRVIVGGLPSNDPTSLVTLKQLTEAQTALSVFEDFKYSKNQFDEKSIEIRELIDSTEANIASFSANFSQIRQDLIDLRATLDSIELLATTASNDLAATTLMLQSIESGVLVVTDLAQTVSQYKSEILILNEQTAEDAIICGQYRASAMGYYNHCSVIAFRVEQAEDRLSFTLNNIDLMDTNTTMNAAAAQADALSALLSCGTAKLYAVGEDWDGSYIDPDTSEVARSGKYYSYWCNQYFWQTVTFFINAQTEADKAIAASLSVATAFDDVSLMVYGSQLGWQQGFSLSTDTVVPTNPDELHKSALFYMKMAEFFTVGDPSRGDGKWLDSTGTLQSSANLCLEIMFQNILSGTADVSGLQSQISTHSTLISSLQNSIKSKNLIINGCFNLWSKRIKSPLNSTPSSKVDGGVCADKWTFFYNDPRTNYSPLHYTNTTITYSVKRNTYSPAVSGAPYPKNGVPTMLSFADTSSNQTKKNTLIQAIENYQPLFAGIPILESFSVFVEGALAQGARVETFFRVYGSSQSSTTNLHIYTQLLSPGWNRVELLFPTGLNDLYNPDKNSTLRAYETSDAPFVAFFINVLGASAGGWSITDVELSPPNTIPVSIQETELLCKRYMERLDLRGKKEVHRIFHVATNVPAQSITSAGISQLGITCAPKMYPIQQTNVAVSLNAKMPMTVTTIDTPTSGVDSDAFDDMIVNMYSASPLVAGWDAALANNLVTTLLKPSFAFSPAISTPIVIKEAFGWRDQINPLIGFSTAGLALGKEILAIYNNDIFINCDFDLTKVGIAYAKKN